MTKENLFISLKGDFPCQFVYSLQGVLAKITLRSCVTRDSAISIKTGRFEYFDATNPISGKGVSYSIQYPTTLFGDVGILMLLAC